MLRRKLSRIRMGVESMNPREVFEATEAALERMWDVCPEGLVPDLTTPLGRLLDQVAGAVSALQELHDALEIDTQAVASCEAMLSASLRPHTVARTTDEGETFDGHCWCSLNRDHDAGVEESEVMPPVYFTGDEIPEGTWILDGWGGVRQIEDEPMCNGNSKPVVAVRLPDYASAISHATMERGQTGGE